MKLSLFKLFVNIILISDKNISLIERVQCLLKSLIAFAPIAWLLSIINLWFYDNQLFFTTIVFFVLINTALGGYMHHKKEYKSFNWGTLLRKTSLMIAVLFLTYFVLELTLKVAGSNFVTEGFRITLQITTLLYPGSKILKNTFILSNGEHPPGWLMKKIYDFQKNGDLSEFLKNKDFKEDQSPNIEDDEV